MMTLQAPSPEHIRPIQKETFRRSLSSFLLKVSFFNLFILAAVGVVLRAFTFLPRLPFSYLNLLHGHSHFAFGGWLMPAILALLIRSFPEMRGRIEAFHWRNVTALLLLSAYGMLITFPYQGYQAISIMFSTLSIFAGFYLGVLLWKASGFLQSNTAKKFLRAGIVYLAVSAIGPFATGPLIAMEKAGSALYYDAIYFYLHFQYNGWFSFVIFAFIYNLLDQNGTPNSGSLVFGLLNLACIPAFFLSTLWHQPSIVFNLMGGIAALLQLIAFVFMFRDVALLRLRNPLDNWLVRLSFFALAIKFLLQVLSALPQVSALAYENRNFTIAYLHLALMGFISFFLIGWFVQQFEFSPGKNMKVGAALFATGFMTTELLLVAAPSALLLFGYAIPHYTTLLLVFSLLLLAGSVFFLKEVLHATSASSTHRKIKLPMLAAELP